MLMSYSWGRHVLGSQSIIGSILFMYQVHCDIELGDVVPSLAVCRAALLFVLLPC